MDGYDLLELIGQGAMGVVYRGCDRVLKREVAIKLLKPELTQPRLVDRFLDEASKSARLAHPNIVHVYHAGKENGRPFIVMEMLHGQTLDKRIEQGALPMDEAVQVARQILAALAAAHAQGVVHRDIKPANVFLCEKGVVKVVDFGIALAMGEARHTEEGMTKGTPVYMSPEQAQGKEISPTSDIYSLGIVLYEMLTGDVPFQAATVTGVMWKHIKESAPLLPDTFPPMLCHIVAKALHKSPTARFSSAEAMNQELEKCKPYLAAGQVWRHRWLYVRLPHFFRRFWPGIAAVITVLMLMVLAHFAFTNLGNRQSITAAKAETEIRTARTLVDNAQSVAIDIQSRLTRVSGETADAPERQDAIRLAQQLAMQRNAQARAALPHAEQAIRLNPRNEGGWLQKSRALYYAADDSSKLMEARRFVEGEALKQFPTSVDLRTVLKLIKGELDAMPSTSHSTQDRSGE